MALQKASDTGLKFHFTYEPGVTQEQMVAFEMAGKAWSHYIKDDMTVNIHVAMSDDLPSKVDDPNTLAVLRNVDAKTVFLD